MTRPADHGVDPGTLELLQLTVATAMTNRRQDREARGLLPLDKETADQQTLSEIAAVVQQYRAGRAAAGEALPPAESDEALIRTLANAILSSGEISDLLTNNEIENIDINAHDEVWITYGDGLRERGLPVARSDAELIDLVQNLASTQGVNPRPFTRAHPRLDLRLRDGSRLSALMSASESPAISIRRNRYPQMFLHTMIELGSIDDNLASFLQATVIAKMNDVAGGETNSGKTTGLRAMINCIGPMERIVTIERSLELGLRRQGRHHDVTEWEEVLPDSDGQGGVSIQELVHQSRRHNPDRVIVGEVIGPEVVEMLSAMSQGNDGSFSTIHARSATGVVRRLALYSRQFEKLDEGVSRELIAEAIDFIIFFHRDRRTNRRMITEVCEVSSATALPTPIFKFDPRAGRAVRVRDHAVTGERMARLAEVGWMDQPHVVFEPRYETSR
jgi:pilus assembly protein CpaF